MKQNYTIRRGAPDGVEAFLAVARRRNFRRAGQRPGQSIAPDMVAVRLTPPFPFVTVANPGYVARHGRPERPDDLRRHACLHLRRSNGAIALWSFTEGNKTIEARVSGPLIAQDYPTLIGAAMQGVGLALVPEPLVLEAIRQGQLVAVLEDFGTVRPGDISLSPGQAPGPAQAQGVYRAYNREVATRTGWILTPVSIEPS